MSDYTPTTQDVRDTWEASLMEGIAPADSKQDANWDPDRMAAQFDRWLAGIKAEAWQHGALEGEAYGRMSSYIDAPKNPHVD